MTALRFRPAYRLSLVALLLIGLGWPLDRQIAPLAARAALQRQTPAGPAQTTAPAVELLGSVGGEIATVVVSGTLAYIGEGLGLTILDVGSPAAPTRLAHLSLGHEPRSIELVDGRAYISGSYRGDGEIQIVDVSDPATPLLLGRIDLQANGIQVIGSRAYLATDQGLQIFDISDPARPALLGSYPALSFVQDVRVAGGDAYLAARDKLVILDVSNPASPALRGSITTAANGVRLAGTLAYVYGTHEFGCGKTICTETQLAIVDISAPTSPTLHNRYINLAGARDMEIAGSLAYFTGDSRALQIFDISNPISPTLRGTFAGFGTEVAVAGNHAYVVNYHNLQILDVGVPATPVLRRAYTTPIGIQAVQVAGERAYVAAGNGFYVLDVANPSKPGSLGSIRLGSPRDVEVVQDRAFVADGISGLQIIDIGDPLKPTRLGSYEPLNGLDVHVVDNLAFVADFYYGLRIIDISNPISPTLRGSYALPIPSMVQVKDKLAYLTYWSCVTAGCTGGLHILDVSDPAHPLLRGRYEHSSSVYDMQVVDGFAYLASDTGLQVVDVRDPARPQLRSDFRIPEGARKARVVGGLAYTVGNSGLRIYDIGRQVSFTPRGHYPTVGYDLQVVGDLVYVAGAFELQILRVHPDRLAPTVPLTPKMSLPFVAG